MTSEVVLRRLILPVVLATACIATWVAAQRLGDLAVEPVAAVGSTEEQLGTPMTSVRRAPWIATTSLRGQRIDLALQSMPEPPSLLSCATVMLDGEVVHEVRGDAGLVTGFAQLLATGHIALDRLGPGHRFDTRVMAVDRPDENGRLRGDLYLIGGGDPVLMTYGYSRGFRPIHTTRTPFEDLVTSVVDAGITGIDGAVVGVEARYDRTRTPRWPGSYLDAGIAGWLTALQVDDGFVRRPIAGSGAVGAVEPAQLAADRFTAALLAEGIEVTSTARQPTEDESLTDLVPITSITSPTLAELTWQLWAVNDASAAEMLMKELGLQFGTGGSTAAGGEVVRESLADSGVVLDTAPSDGSGLDPAGALGCRALADTMRSIPADHPSRGLLPTPDLPGVYDGLLADLGIRAELRLVGGVVGDTASFVATTVDEGSEVVIASIVNRSGGPDDRDVAYHRELLERIDDLRLAWSDVSIDDGDDR